MNHSRVFSALGLAAIFLSPTCRAADGPGTNWLVVGEATNGIRGEIDVGCTSNRNLSEIVISVNQLDGTTISNNESGLRVYERLRKFDWDYWMGTNSFCGVVEMRDQAGRLVPALKPEATSPGAYPATFSLSRESGKHFSQFKIGEVRFYSGPRIFPNPLFGIALRFELARFQIRGPDKPAEPDPVVPEPVLVHPVPVSFLSPGAVNLGEFFDIKQPGDYTLTVWPKIYKRSAQDKDLCERIDLPPVTATFKWPENASQN
jgi:hypothetical protein